MWLLCNWESFASQHVAFSASRSESTLRCPVLYTRSKSVLCLIYSSWSLQNILKMISKKFNGLLYLFLNISLKPVCPFNAINAFQPANEFAPLDGNFSIFSMWRQFSLYQVEILPDVYLYNVTVCLHRYKTTMIQRTDTVWHLQVKNS